MIRALNYLACAILLLVSFLSCKRTQKDNIIGPDFKSASSNFQILDSFKVYSVDKSSSYKTSASDFSKIQTVDLSRAETSTVYVIEKIKNSKDVEVDSLVPKDKIRFKARNTYFKAKFNEVVRWNINISPVNSDPKFSPYKNISGTSDYIDSIPEWTWDGSSDNQFYFVPGSIDFKLTILGSKDSILTNKNLVNTTVLDSVNTGILLNDFEGQIPFTAYGDKKDLVPYDAPHLVSNIPLTPQGSKSMLLSGIDNNGDYFVAGNQQKFSKGMLAGHAASDIYINVYIYGFPTNSGITPNATKIGIGVSQDNRNDSGEFDADQEDTFDQQISVDWVGWRLVSVKYSNLKRSSSITDGGNGPNKIQPETAVQIGCNILSSPNGSNVAAAIDYLIVTFGKPLDK